MHRVHNTHSSDFFHSIETFNDRMKKEKKKTSVTLTFSNKFYRIVYFQQFFFSLFKAKSFGLFTQTYLNNEKKNSN